MKSSLLPAVLCVITQRSSPHSFLHENSTKRRSIFSSWSNTVAIEKRARKLRHSTSKAKWETLGKRTYLPFISFHMFFTHFAVIFFNPLNKIWTLEEFIKTGRLSIKSITILQISYLRSLPLHHVMLPPLRSRWVLATSFLAHFLWLPLSCGP